MMKITQLFIALTLTLSTLVYTTSTVAAPAQGSLAPEFKLSDQFGITHSLIDYRGQWVVLYFYPKDNTRGCTIEAGKFRDQKSAFSERNTTVFGVSLDDVESHLDFSETLKLNFSLLADETKSTSKSYDVLTDLGLIAYSSRETFIIDPEGRIAHHFDEVTPKTHTAMVLKKLDELIEIYK